MIYSTLYMQFVIGNLSIMNKNSIERKKKQRMAKELQHYAFNSKMN